MLKFLYAVLATLLLTTSSAVLAQSVAAPSAGRRVIDEADRVVLHGNVPWRARPELEVGRADANLPMKRMILLLALRPGAQAQLARLLAEQQDPASPRYHKWLTPAEFGARFGLPDAGVQAVAGWLAAQGFTVEEVAQGRGWINFSGVASQVEKTFATEIHDYQVGGKIHHANSIEPSIPRGLADRIAGIVSLHSFQRRPRHTTARAVAGLEPRFNAQDGSHYMAPADFGTIYDLNQAYHSGNDGAGESIAIVARSDIRLSDVRSFRGAFGLPANDPVFVLNGADPGISPGDEEESDLDTQWAGAVAPKATVKLVISASTNSTDGVLLSAQYIIDQNLAAVATTSYGLCEAELGATERALYEGLLAQGAAEGITSFAPAGDSGASDCDLAASAMGSGRAVESPCTSPNNTCVGGTQFDDLANPGAYWAPANAQVTRASALSYIPEVAWNESGNAAGGADLWSTGGGASAFFAKPAWQSAPGVPADGQRDVPDVSFAAAAHDGYLAYYEGQLYGFGGTSAAAPSFAGLMALLVQRTGARQGNINSTLYQLAARQYGAAGPAVFHDVTTGNNSVPGVNGYSAGTAYDQVSGLGSVDGQLFLSQWPGSTTTGNPPPCAPTTTTLCLDGNRFAVSATFNSGASGSGNAQVVSLGDDTGYLWFFAASNAEALVKVLNGCGLGGHYWFFAGGLTNVNVVLTVTDTQAGVTKTYTNPQGTRFEPIQDTTAFSTCP